MPDQSTLMSFCKQCDQPFIPTKTRKQFCSISCRSKYSNHHRAKSHTLSSRGYVMTLNPDYPDNGRPQYIQEHRLVMERHLGRRLLPEEIVHHKDGNRLNNDISNLEVMRQGDHARIHVTVKGWTRKYPCCIDCGTTERKHAGGGRCRLCHTRHQRNPAFLRLERKDAWAMKYDQCVKCGTTERPHSCKGLCTRCYEQGRNRVWTHEINVAHYERRKQRNAEVKARQSAGS